jgi:UTP--glucose-1-phosphate uridylyltransferase
VRSDAYVLDEDAGIRPSPRRDPALGPPVVTLDPRYYQGIDDFESRFAHPLSLVACTSLTVKGDICFGRDVRIQGDVVLRNPDQRQKVVKDGAVFGSGTHLL